MTEAKEGERVKMHFTGRREGGTVFGTSKEDVPVEFVIRKGSIISGLEKGVIGMGERDRKRITLQPKEEFGPMKKELIKVVGKGKFPESLTSTIGLQVQLRNPDGDTIDANVVDIKGDSIFFGCQPSAGRADVETACRTI